MERGVTKKKSGEKEGTRMVALIAIVREIVANLVTRIVNTAVIAILLVLTVCLESTESMGITEIAENTESTEITEIAENTESTASTASTASTENIEITEDTKRKKGTEAMEEAIVENEKKKVMTAKLFEIKMLKLGIEPKTFALLARRSNQLSYSSTDFFPFFTYSYLTPTFSSFSLYFSSTLHATQPVDKPIENSTTEQPLQIDGKDLPDTTDLNKLLTLLSSYP